jgi:hypothetical protein
MAVMPKSAASMGKNDSYFVRSTLTLEDMIREINDAIHHAVLEANA